jgi:ABC-type transport system involved in multi-copper enzyme maturation permease subunit
MNKIIVIAGMVWMEMWRRKTLQVLGILMAAVLLLLFSINISGLGRIPGYVKETGLLLTWLLGWILAINMAVRQLPQEEKRGTVYALLARPVSRLQLLLGKWLGAWMAATGAVVCFYVLTVVIVKAFGGSFGAMALLQAMGLHVMLLAMLTALAVLFSVRSTQEAASVLSYIFSAAMFAFIPRIPEFVSDTTGWRETAMLIIYTAMPHFELFDMRRRVVHLHGPISWVTWSMILLYGAMITAILLIIAWLAFRHRHFSRLAKD